MFFVLIGVFAPTARGQFVERPEPPPQADLKFPHYGHILRSYKSTDTISTIPDAALAIEAYLKHMGLGNDAVNGDGEFRNATRGMFIPAGSYALKTTIDWPNLGGGELYGVSGEAGIIGEGQYDAFSLNHTRLVWYGADSGGPMIEYNGHGAIIERLSLQGDSSLGVPDAAAAVHANKANWPAVGLQINDDSDADTPLFGPGKLQSRQLGIAACKVGINCGTEVLGEQADETHIERLTASFCDTVFRNDTQQNVNNTFGTIHAFACDKIFDLPRGGNYEIDWVYVGDYNDLYNACILLTTGEQISTNANNMHIGTVSPDGSTTEFRLWSWKTMPTSRCTSTTSTARTAGRLRPRLSACSAAAGVSSSTSPTTCRTTASTTSTPPASRPKSCSAPCR